MNQILKSKRGMFLVLLKSVSSYAIFQEID